MKKIVFTLLIVCTVQLRASNEVGCVCKDKTVQTPDCGPCGSSFGSMEQTGSGVICRCSNGLKSHEVSCAEACQNHEGWSGKKS